MDLDLNGKTAIVTGGSKGIGKAIARQLALEGADVAILARTEETLSEAAIELAAETGRRIIPIAADTGNDDSVKQAVQQAAGALGHLDILVNAAAAPGGYAPPPAVEEINDESFWPDMNVKVMGYLRCAREVVPYMKQRRWGRIINISGLAARSSGNTVGSMRNVAVAAMTKNLADELGSFGINVTCVHPSTTRTERMAPRMQADAERLGLTLEQVEKRYADANSIRHLVDAAEIAYIVAFLASPKSIAITGDSIAAGGGAGRAIYY